MVTSSRPAPSAVLFDLDGVLVDSYDLWFELMSAASRHFGYPPLAVDAFHAAWGQSVADDRETFFPQHTEAQVASYYEAHFADHLDHLAIAEGVEHLFGALAARQIPTAVVTNTPQPLAGDLVARAGATPDVLVGGTDVAHPKPAPDMLLRACGLLHVEPSRVVMVGDSDFDRAAARAAGCRFIGFGTAGDLRIDHLDELVDLL